jgi:hypothetical protein
MTSKLIAALDELNDTMAEAYRVHAEKFDRPVPGEHQRRRNALRAIDEILQCRPLASFKAVHLEFLEVLIAYWRELEVEGEGRAPLAPEPDPLQ